MARSTLNKLSVNSRRQPQDPEAWYAQGVAAFERGELEAGRQDLLASTQMGPPVLERLLSVAHRLAAVGFAADAAMVLRRAIESFAERPEPKLALAWLYLESGDPRQAMQVAEFALRAHPSDSELHIVAAAAQEEMGANTGAANHLVAVLAADADHLEANRRLAALLGRTGDDAGAERCLRRIVEITQGQDLEAAVSLGIALSSSGRHAEAIDLLAEVARRAPDAAGIRSDLGMALLAAGDLDGGIAAFTDALQLDPRSAQGYCGLGLAYRQLERYGEAADAFRASEQLAPEQATASFNLGLVLAAAGDAEGARKAMLRAAALAPDDAEIQESLQSILVPSAAARPAPSQAADKKAELSASISGDLTGFQLPDVLEFLRSQTKTGSLMLVSPKGAGSVQMIRGRVIDASAPGVRRGAGALIERGSVPREEVVFQQVLDALAEMLRWTEGAFSFHPEADKQLPAISFDVQSVMLELMRLTDERNQ